jgi:hypothetical protein
VLSSLLSARRDDAPPTIGLASLPTCLAHFGAVTALGFRAAALHCEGFAPGEEVVQTFRRRFGCEADAATGPAAGKGGTDLP